MYNTRELCEEGLPDIDEGDIRQQENQGEYLRIELGALRFVVLLFGI